MPKKIPFLKSFASCEKSKFWSNKNKLDPTNVKINSHKMFIFDCGVCGHEFKSKLYNINFGRWCPYCSNNKMCGDINCRTCFNKSFAVHNKSIYWSDRNTFEPYQVFKSSTTKAYFICNNCGHEFFMKLNNINNGGWCPYCASRKLCDNNDCELCFNKSFASHHKSKYWSKKNKNKPRSVFLNSKQKFIFDCGQCNHEILISLLSINSGSWCCFCANQKLCLKKNCIICFNKSFASHKKAKYWSVLNKLSPFEVFKQSNKKFIFDCTKCNHTFNMTPSNVVRNKWCSFCGNSKLCQKKNCVVCFNKSFASHEKAIFWSKDNLISPRQVFKGTYVKYLFDCAICKCQFSARVDNIVYGSTWCSFCKNKTEKILFNKLFKYYPTLIHNFNPVWCKNKDTDRILPFDFVIPEHNIIIELDGEQHFKQVGKWNSPDHNQIRDIYKMKCANNNGYNVIRILQDHVYRNRYECIDFLINSIELLIKKNKNNKILNIFICYDNEYDTHINALKTE